MIFVAHEGGHTVDHPARPVPYAVHMPAPGTAAQSFVRPAAAKGVDELIQGNEHGLAVSNVAGHQDAFHVFHGFGCRHGGLALSADFHLCRLVSQRTARVQREKTWRDRASGVPARRPFRGMIAVGVPYHRGGQPFRLGTGVHGKQCHVGGVREILLVETVVAEMQRLRRTSAGSIS